MEDTLEYWKKIKEDRIQDLAAEEAIDTPDDRHYRLLKKSLIEAQNKINEINGI